MRRETGQKKPEGSLGMKKRGGGKGKNDLSKRATEHVIGEQVQKVHTDDPRYEWDDETGKRRERPFPEGLTAHERKILKKVRKRARCLDYGINICGLRFGPSALIGFIPIIGDCADFTLGMMLVVKKSRKADIPKLLVAKMIRNHLVSEGFGLIPIFGDIFIAWFKANLRNSWLLEEFLVERAMERLEKDVSHIEEGQPANVVEEECE